MREPENHWNSLVLIRYFALGTFRVFFFEATFEKETNDFQVDFSMNFITFSASNSASIFDSTFLQKWSQKGGQKSHFFMKNVPSGAQETTYSTFWKVFEVFKKRSIFRCSFGGLQNRPKIEPWAKRLPPSSKTEIRLSSHTRLQRSKPPGREPIIKEIQGKKD